jgi:hypothetical protein
MFNITTRTLEIVKISLLGGITIGYCGVYYEYFGSLLTSESKITT